VIRKRRKELVNSQAYKKEWEGGKKEQFVLEKKVIQ